MFHPPTRLPKTLEPDPDTKIIYQDAHRCPLHPLKPAFVALGKLKSSFRISSLDVVIHRHVLTQLYYFCSTAALNQNLRANLYVLPGKKGDEDDEDDGGGQSEKGTLLVENCCWSSRQLQTPKQGSGFGKGFERLMLRAIGASEGRGSFHRMLRYDMGGLRMGVICEVDGGYDGPEEGMVVGAKEEVMNTREEDNHSAISTFEESANASHDDNADNAESERLGINGHDYNDGGDTAPPSCSPYKVLLRSPGTRNLTTYIITSPRDKFSPIVNVISGEASRDLVNVSERWHPAELKTGLSSGSRRSFPPKLWFGRTRYLIRGYCRRNSPGTLRKVVVEDWGEKLAGFETDAVNQRTLRQLAWLLERLRELVSLDDPGAEGRGEAASASGKGDGAVFGRPYALVFEKGTKLHRLLLFRNPELRARPFPRAMMERFSPQRERDGKEERI